MQQVEFSLTPLLINFLNDHKQYGFKDESSMVRAALEELQEAFKWEGLKESADLYREIYTEDAELAKLTEAAIDGWPERQC